MTDGGKEWVTIRIPEPTRDDASDDPRTYEEIMRAGLRAPEFENTPDGPADFEELSEQLDRIEAAAKEATNAAQNAERAITEATQQ